MCVCREKMHKKHPQKPFHPTSHCDYWHWQYPLTMSGLCISCIYVIVHNNGTFPRFNFTSPQSWSFCDLFFPVLQERKVTCMKCIPGKLDYLSNSSWPLAGVCDANCDPVDMCRYQHMCFTLDLWFMILWFMRAGSPPLHIGKTTKVGIYFQF